MSNETDLPEVMCYISEIDGALVVEIDGDGPAHVRINYNDNLIADWATATDRNI